MKIQQEPKFQPITLVLETKEEAEALWELVDSSGIEISSRKRQLRRKLRRKISNWFSTQAQLGGS